MHLWAGTGHGRLRALPAGSCAGALRDGLAAARDATRGQTW